MESIYSSLAAISVILLILWGLAEPLREAFLVGIYRQLGDEIETLAKWLVPILLVIASSTFIYCSLNSNEFSGKAAGNPPPQTKPDLTTNSTAPLDQTDRNSTPVGAVKVSSGSEASPVDQLEADNERGIKRISINGDELQVKSDMIRNSAQQTIETNTGKTLSKDEVEQLAAFFGLLKATKVNPHLTFNAGDISFWYEEHAIKKRRSAEDLTLEFAARRIVLDAADKQGLEIPTQGDLSNAAGQVKADLLKEKRKIETTSIHKDSNGSEINLTPKVKIDDIVENRYIKGKVSNLANPENYKVLVYVLTDKWHIHPYANQNEGKSWAAIDANSNWSIPTEKREFIAMGIAVLVVDRSVAEDAPSSLNKIDQIRNHTVMIYSREEMRQSGWYGRL